MKLLFFCFFFAVTTTAELLRAANERNTQRQTFLPALVC